MEHNQQAEARQITSVQEEQDTQGRMTGVEKEVTAEEGSRIAEPFDPEDIDVITKSMTVDLLLSRARSGMINLQPDFQRRWGIWDGRRQSRLIESLLLRIPLPNLYAAEDDEEKWEIVDGIQRLSTIARFIEPEIIDEAALTLSDLEYLKDFEGKTFEELTPKLQLRLRETELVIHLIRRGTPADVKFNIFARINTGGIALSSQELRHAITPGSARVILEKWAELPAFKKATDNSVRSVRMDDRELVLRFLAFRLTPPIHYKPDIDGFLISTMRAINQLPSARLEELKTEFTVAMETAHAIFNNDAFRKRYSTDASRMPINKALFEATSVALAALNDAERSTLIRRKDELKRRFIELCNKREFETSISQGTGDIAKVQRRFSLMEQLFRGVIDP